MLAPFQLVAAKRGAKIVDVNLTRDSEEIDLEVGGCCLLRALLLGGTDRGNRPGGEPAPLVSSDRVAPACPIGQLPEADTAAGEAHSPATCHLALHATLPRPAQDFERKLSRKTKVCRPRVCGV